MGADRVSTSSRSRRRRPRRVLRGLVRLTSWLLVLAGVFVLGIGYGRVVSRDDERSSDTMSIERDAIQVTATLPPRTVTVTRTVTVRRGSASKR